MLVIAKITKIELQKSLSEEFLKKYNVKNNENVALIEIETP